jgi:hypothetical protein
MITPQYDSFEPYIPERPEPEIDRPTRVTGCSIQAANTSSSSALMNKLLVAVYSVAKNRRPFVIIQPASSPVVAAQ